MKKIIIDNQSDLSLLGAVVLVESVVASGKISNNGKQHCYLSKYGDYMVTSILNKKSERFVIYKEGKQ